MFLDALPVLVFARRVLGGTAWRAPLCQANVIVDDPNLRFRRYGHLDFRQAATLAQERHFHLTVGFVPIDYRRTAPAIARLLHENPKSNSLDFHGNDHLKREMGRNVAYSVADFSVRQALARMDHHRSLTGLRAARVMTLPHGVVNRVWVKALSSAGYAAAIARRSYSFAENPEEEGADALYEMRPAETSLLGFPIINRFRLEDPIEEVLFAAWLGKPIILYTHHHSFADWNTLVAKVEFVNRHAQPVWTDIETLVRHNYLLRQTSTIVEVATFSNDIEVTVPADCAKVILLRCGQDMAECGQTFDASNYTAQPLGSSPTEVSAALTLSERPDRLRVRFRTPVDDTPAPTGWHRTRHASRVRRVLTETRDRVYPAITAIRSF